MTSICIKIIQGRELSGDKGETNWPENWPVTEAAWWVHGGSLHSPDYFFVHATFPYWGKKGFLREKNVQNALQLCSS